MGVNARDEAIDAINNAAVNYQTAGDLLDAIPTGVLARLAIECGGLEEVGVWESDSADRSGVFYEDEELPEDATPLYRLVDQ